MLSATAILQNYQPQFCLYNIDIWLCIFSLFESLKWMSWGGTDLTLMSTALSVSSPNTFTLEKVAGCALWKHWRLHSGPNRYIKRILDDKSNNIRPHSLILTLYPGGGACDSLAAVHEFRLCFLVRWRQCALLNLSPPPRGTGSGMAEFRWPCCGRECQRSCGVSYLPWCAEDRQCKAPGSR